MSTNQQLAKKYRPSRFDQVLGQKHVISGLKGLLRRGKFPDAMLFVGPSGVGKTTLARLFAHYSGCKELVNNEPCGKCSGCRSTLPVVQGASTTSSDVTEINAALDGGIDLIRQLRDLSVLNPVSSKYRVFILDEAHQITPSAFNGALKLLEDPSELTRYIFCTTNPEKLPSAIVGRCREGYYTLDTLDHMEVAKRLFGIARKEGLKLPEDLLKKICVEAASSSGGDVRTAIGQLDMVLSFVAGQGGVDKIEKSMYKEVVAHAAAMTPSTLVQEYMNGIFENSFSRSFQAIKLASNHAYFTQRILETWHQLTYRWIDSDQLADKDKFWMMKGFRSPPTDFMRKVIKSSDDLEVILNGYAEALERIKAYTTDPITVLQIHTLRVAKIIQRWAEAS